MKKILCPTDFSETAHNAIAYAAKLAQATQSDITLLNVQSMFDFSPAEIISGKQMTIETVKHELENQSLEISKVFKIACYAEVESTFRKLSSVLHDKAMGFDLVVMGTNGADDLYQFFGGSNTYNAIIKSDTPVLLVPNGNTYSTITSMVYAYDYLRERNLPLAKLIPLIKLLKCKLSVLQVMEEAYSKEAIEELEELQFIIKNAHGADVNLDYQTIRSSNVAESIDSYIHQHQPDALALCSVHRNLIQNIFHKSVIKNISAASSYPVFVFHK